MVPRSLIQFAAISEFEHPPFWKVSSFGIKNNGVEITFNAIPLY
jgi:hypothetical protein